MITKSAYGLVARRFTVRNAKFSVPRTERNVRRFGMWDEFRKDKNFQELGEEMSKLRDRVEQKAKEAKDSQFVEQTTSRVESMTEKTRESFDKMGEGLGKTKERVSETVQSTTESFQAKTESVSGEGRRQKFVSRFTSVRETVYSSTSSATKRMGDATRAMGNKTKEKLQLNTKIPNLGKMPNIDPEEQKKRIRDMYGSTMGKTREIFYRQAQSASQEPEESSSSAYPKVLMVEGCVGGATPCNGFYRLQPKQVNDRPVYQGPKLESGDHVTLWFNAASSPSQWIFTPSIMVSEPEVTSLAHVEDSASSPLDIIGQWHVASKRPGRYLPHSGLTVTNQLPSTTLPLDALVVYEAELSWFQAQSRKFAKTKYYKNMQARMVKMRKTESFQKISKVGGAINERVTIAQTQFDESQNPMVHSIRNKIDYVSLETEHGSGINAIRRDFYPDFWPEDFLDFAEADIIPVFCKKFLEGDMTWLRLACAGDAERHCFASVKERMAQEHYWDEHILWMHEPMLEAVLLENKKPYVRFSFTIQHIDCSRNAKGEVVDGHPSKIANLVFVMTVTPMPENDEIVGFPWRIEHLMTHKAQAIV